MFFMTPSKFNQGLDSLSFHTGIDEICHYFRDVQTDDYITGLVQEVKDANQRLFDALNVGKARHNVQQEVKQLNDSIVAAHRFIDSCCYLPDAEVKSSAKELKKLFGSYGKPLTRMDMDTQMTVVKVLLHDWALTRKLLRTTSDCLRNVSWCFASTPLVVIFVMRLKKGRKCISMTMASAMQ